MWHWRKGGGGAAIRLVLHAHTAERGLEIREAALIGAVEGNGRLVDDGAVAYRPCGARLNGNLRNGVSLCLLDSSVALQAEVLVAASAMNESSTSCADGARLCSRESCRRVVFRLYSMEVSITRVTDQKARCLPAVGELGGTTGAGCVGLMGT